MSYDILYLCFVPYRISTILRPISCISYDLTILHPISYHSVYHLPHHLPLSWRLHAPPPLSGCPIPNAGGTGSGGAGEGWAAVASRRVTPRKNTWQSNIPSLVFLDFVVRVIRTLCWNALSEEICKRGQEPSLGCVPMPMPKTVGITNLYNAK